MEFKSCDRDARTDCNVQSWASENDVFRLELNRVIFGSRVMLRHTNNMGYSLDYCAGANRQWQEALVNVLRLILRTVPEDTSLYQLEQMFPHWSVRPMYKDETCWNALLDMAKVEERDVIELSELDL